MGGGRCRRRTGASPGTQGFYSGTMSQSPRPVYCKLKVAVMIFISYRKEDTQDLAWALADKLGQAFGKANIFLDRNTIKPGQSWKQTIDQALTRSSAVLAVIGPRWLKSYDEKTGQRLLDREDDVLAYEIWVSLMQQPRITIIPLYVNGMKPLTEEALPARLAGLAELQGIENFGIGKDLDELQTKLRGIVGSGGGTAGVTRPIFRDLIKPLNFDAETNLHLARFTGREWVEERLDKWIVERPDSRAFCLVGGPGIGKSAIACHWSHTREDVVAFHYCVHGDEERTDVKRTLLSLAAQIAMQFPEYERYLMAMEAEQLKDILKGSARTIFDNLLLLPLKDVPAPGEHKLVIIDGLDEASRGAENELAGFLGEIWGALPLWLRLVVTSRQELDVSYYLASLNTFFINAESRENLNDISTYLRRELAPLGAAVNDDVIHEIVEKSEGMFLYARLMLEEIRSGALSLSHPGEFPEGLTGCYQRWFGRKFRDIGEYHNDFHKLVSVIAAQKAPLPLNVISAACGVDMWLLDQRLNRLGVLFPLRVESKGNQKLRMVTMMHKSLHDWLTGVHHLTGRPRAGAFAADGELGNRLLAEQGLKVYRDGKLAEDSYFRQTLLSHLSLDGQYEELARVLLDPLLLELLWFEDTRYDWQQHISELGRFIRPGKLVEDWIAKHCTPDGRDTVSPAVAGRLGRVFEKLGAFDEAMALVESALRLWDEKNVTDSPEMVTTLLAKGTIQTARDELEGATVSYEKALAIAERAYSAESREMADVLYQLCVFYTKGKRDYRKASNCLDRALAIYSASIPPNYGGMADCINDKAVILEAEGRAGEYIGFYQEALTLFQKGYPNGHPEMVANLANIGHELQKEPNKDAETIAYYRRAVDLANRILLPQHEYSGFAHKGLSDALFSDRMYEEGLEVMRAYEKAFETSLGPDHEETSEARLSLCRSLLHCLHFSEAGTHSSYRNELRAVCQRIRLAKPATILGLLDLANDARRVRETQLSDLLNSTGLHVCRATAARARANETEAVSYKCFADAVDILMGGGDLATALPQVYALWDNALPGLRNLADHLSKTRKLIVSLIVWHASASLYWGAPAQVGALAFDAVERIGAEIPDTLDRLAHITVALKRRRYYDVSEALCGRLLKLSRKLLGEDHSQTLTYLANLAYMRECIGSLEDASALLGQTFEARCRVLGCDHSDTISSASSLIGCLLRMGKEEEATAVMRGLVSRLPISNSPTSGRHWLAATLNQRAIELKDSFAEYEAARRCYEFALELSPDDATTCSNLALLLWSCIGDFDSAGERFEQASKLAPLNGLIQSTYALFLTHTKLQFDSALEHFKRSIELSPNESYISGNFATWHIIKGNLNEAWKLAKEAMRLCRPKPDRTMVRPLFCAAAILMLEHKDPSVPLGQIKTLFEHGINHVAWIVTALLDELDRRLAPEDAQFFRAISAAIADSRKIDDLNAFSLWKAAPLAPFDIDWPKTIDYSVV